MRIIKFRAWYPYEEEGEMVNDIWINLEMGELFADNDALCEREGHSKAVLMEYTGLKDKNGKEIYSGDLVKCPITGESEDYLQLEAGDKDYVMREISIPEVYQEGLPDDCEVVGNIYENPELSKGQLK